MYGEDLKIAIDICCKSYSNQYMKFDYGNKDINDYLNSSNRKKDLGKGVTYLVINEEDDKYNLSDYIFDTVIADINDLTETKVGAEYAILYSVKDAISFYDRNGFEKINKYIVPLYDRFVDECELMIMEL